MIILVHLYIRINVQTDGSVIKNNVIRNYNKNWFTK